MGLKSDKVISESPTLLDNGEVYTSSAIPVSTQRRFTGTVFSDQSSATDGVKIMQSADGGSNYDYITSFTLTGGTGLGFSVELIGDYVKIQYTNNTTLQTVFRVNAFLKET